MKNNSIGGLYFKVLLYVIFVMFFLTFNQGIFVNEFTKYADEVSLLLSVWLLFALGLKEICSGKVEKIYIALILYFLVQIINYLNSPFDLSLLIVISQAFINIKVIVVSLAAIALVDRVRALRLFHALYFICVVLFLFGIILNLVLQDGWNELLGYKIEYRYGFLRLAGWFSDTGQNAYFFVLFFSTSFFLYFKKQIFQMNNVWKKFFIFTVIDFFTAFVLTVRKGLLLMMPLFYMAMKTMRLEGRVFFLIFSAGFMLFSYYLLSDMQIFIDTEENVSNFFHDEHGYVRGLVVYYGFALFIDFFPFGVGAATFGSALSQYNTLAVYEYVGMPVSLYLEDGVFRSRTAIYDSGLSSFLAENGFIGFIALIMVVVYFFRINRRQLDPYNYMIFCIITWFTIFLTIVDPVMQGGLYTVFYVMNLLLLYSKNYMIKADGRWIVLNQPI